MRLHRLRVRNFAAIRELEIAFGQGLNVLYGPNEIGKSSLANAIRLALLLPSNSTYHERFISWSGADDPFVELTFETEAQRVWQVQKQFGRRGTALLRESRDGREFNDVERGRGVEARLREILRWGIPEPGGSGAGKGLPASFLATALLSTQANVADVLQESLSNDPTTTGKDQIAAALEAVAQDPLFTSLLRKAQERRDEAYTDKGAKKTARGSVFKIAADRVKETREEKERLEKIVEESDRIERHLRGLEEERERREQERVAAEEGLLEAQLLAQQIVDRAMAAEKVRVAREAVLRIQKMDREVAEAEERARDLVQIKTQTERALQEAQTAEAEAGKAMAAVEESARSAGLDSEMADTVARQEIELRKAAVEQSAREARQRVELIDAAARAEAEHRRQEAEAARAQKAWTEAAQAEQSANESLLHHDLLARGLEARLTDKQAASARAEVEKESVLQTKLAKASADRADLAERRAAIAVPPAGILAALRKLETEIASARGALDVGLVLTVIPTAIINLRVRKDGIAAESGVMAQPLEVEANSEVEVDVADLATVRVRGGRRQAQERVRALESRWESEAFPHLTAAGATDLEALETKVNEARELDSQIQSLDGELESLRRQIADLAGAAEALREASARAAACHLELGDVALETLAAELDALGPDPGAALRKNRQEAARRVESARAASQAANTAQALAEERVRSAQENLEAATAARDAALSEAPSGMAGEAAAADEALRSALEEQEKLAAELGSLQRRIDARRAQLESALAEARQSVERAGRTLEAARESQTKAVADHAGAEARLLELRKVREAEDLSAAELELREAAERHDALPVPKRLVSAEEVTGATRALETLKQSLEVLDREIHKTQGALQQVGGAVAREWLRDATEAFHLAVLQDREIEADYEAWKLLLEQMKEADAAQASNLGRALAPAIEERFRVLTRQRYGSLQITANLKTEGVIVAGELRSPEEVSVGTREQLSTLYRLCLGEYLQTAIVLDDQLVQSDDTRMGWFRELLAEKGRRFQIVVFTCRPGDYLTPEAIVAGDGAASFDSEDGFVRAIDLERVGRTPPAAPF